ncbi:ABC transporter permease [Granulicella sp. WH15]|uniref:ABC transporter permease n=1 Tax=Granulicella sp. WH15 TaxID=2602070 RepID=UPI0013668F30|nr:FtsX-like permease family protein [Granulicella sp. WH15]QHN02450.1 ABC transporter permease [Granulicella sp. WH15]
MVNKLIFANLAHRPLRTLLSVIAIGVEVTMILTLVGVSYGTLDASARRARGIGADVFVRPPSSSVMSLSSAPLSDKVVPALAARPGVAQATGTMVQSMGGFDTIQGIDFPSINKMAGGFKFVEGGPLVGPDDMIVDQVYARQKKIHAGEHLTLLNHDWNIAGVFESGKLATVLVRIDTLQNLTGNPGKISAVYLKLTDPSHADDFVEQLKKALPGYMIYTVEEFTAQISVSSVKMLQDFIYVVIGIASIVGFIVVFMAMYTAVLERTREIGILKAVGASSSYIVNILFRETILLALIGTAVGILMTYGTQWLMAHAVPASLVQETVYWWWPIAGAIAVVGAVVGTIIPATKAVNQDVTEALSYE